MPAYGFCGGTPEQRDGLLSYLVENFHLRRIIAVVHRPDLHDNQLSPFASVPGFERTCDLVLVDGRPIVPGRVIQIYGSESSGLHSGTVLQTFGSGTRPERVFNLLLDQLAMEWRKTPVWACVLIGGRSSRMGRPKHLLTDACGQTWLARSVALVRPLVSGVALSGRGDVPDDLADLPRLPDVPGVSGPLAGILSAMRWQPNVSWLVIACDLPGITTEALAWLLAACRPGIWGPVPRIHIDGPVEPLLAHYDFRARLLFEDLARQGCLRVSAVAENKKIETPLVPEHLRPSWRNVNSPEDLRPQE